MHSKGGSIVPSCHVERMEQIRNIAKHYQVSNIYNTDESGLFYRMRPQRMYQSGSEQRDSVRGMEFGKHKERVTIVFACNADGSHVLPVSYLGSANNPRRFRNERFNSKKIVVGPKKTVGWIPKDSTIGSNGGILRCNLVPVVHCYSSWTIVEVTSLKSVYQELY